jgi:hypothetical protein
VKRGLVLTLCMVFLLAFSSMALAVSFSADGSYLLGKNKVGDTETNVSGFLVGANGEVYPNILVEGRFLSLSESEEGKSGSQTILSGSVSYRLIQEGELEVLVGGGYLTYNAKADGEAEAEAGAGLFGKLGVAFRPLDKLALVGDVGYAPQLKFGDDAEDKKTFLTGRISLSYEVLEQLSVQATVVRTGLGGSENTNLVYGGGIVFTF